MLSIIRKTADLRMLVADWRGSRRRVGFVPTMGALHDGHMSLIRASLAECDKTIVSIFVNPRQFDRAQDLANYPRSESADRTMVEEGGVHALYLPSAEDMYPAGFATTLKQSGLTDHLCGATRKGHFEGVLTVVLKFFNVTTPDVAYFGAKDFQQAAIIRRMAIDLNLPIDVRVKPTVREADGLALSSRNRLLPPPHRAAAPLLHAALREADARFRAGLTDPRELETTVTRMLAREPAIRIDYVSLVDADSLQPKSVPAERGNLLALAVFLGEVRLIDNLLLGA